MNINIKINTYYYCLDYSELIISIKSKLTRQVIIIKGKEWRKIEEKKIFNETGQYLVLNKSVNKF